MPGPVDAGPLHLIQLPFGYVVNSTDRSGRYGAGTGISVRADQLDLSILGSFCSFMSPYLSIWGRLFFTDFFVPRRVVRPTCPVCVR